MLIPEGFFFFSLMKVNWLLLLRIPIAFDLLVLKRKWRSFFTWSVVALLLLLVRTFSFYSLHDTRRFTLKWCYKVKIETFLLMFYPRRSPWWQ